MDPIELEHWEPDPADPRYSRQVSQPRAEEVFLELKQRLDSLGMLPDEYFVLDMEWENGREIPKGADIFVTTDYGESEGIYVDLYLKWYEDGKPVIKSPWASPPSTWTECSSRLPPLQKPSTEKVRTMCDKVRFSY